jgi:hypothetical protein
MCAALRPASWPSSAEPSASRAVEPRWVLMAWRHRTSEGRSSADRGAPTGRGWEEVADRGRANNPASIVGPTPYVYGAGAGRSAITADLSTSMRNAYRKTVGSMAGSNAQRPRSRRRLGTVQIAGHGFTACDAQQTHVSHGRHLYVSRRLIRLPPPERARRPTIPNALGTLLRRPLPGQRDDRRF